MYPDGIKYPKLQKMMRAVLCSNRIDKWKCRVFKGHSIDTTHTPPPLWSFYSAFKDDKSLGNEEELIYIELHIPLLIAEH